MSGSVGDNVGRGSGVIVAPSGGLEAGTKTDFFQASAPTEWTQDTGNNDKMLRVVSGSGGGTGGSQSAISPAHNISASHNMSGSHNLSAAAHTLSSSAVPSHGHSVTFPKKGGGGYQYTLAMPSNTQVANPPQQMSATVSNSGSGGSHVHSMSGNVSVAGNVSISGSVTAPLYMDVIIAARDS